MRHSRRGREFGCLGLMLTVALLLVGCHQGASTASMPLSIYFTCDTDGRLEPCGCFTGQYGGLSRLKTVLDGQASTDALRVDVGDATAGHQDYDLIEYQFMLEAFATMKYDALNIGQREAQFSADQLRTVKESSPVPILSANLLDKASGKPLFDSYRIVQRGAFRIGIIGVVDPHGLEQKLGKGLAVGDMDSAIERCLGELRGKTDLVVLLAFTNETTLSELVQQFYECQVILGGKVRQSAQQLVRENRSVIYYVTNESRALGILQLQVSKNAPVQVSANEIRLLQDTIPQDKAIAGKVQTYREKVRYTKLAVDDPEALSADSIPGVRTLASYVGTEKCIVCHKAAGAVWEGSAHAHAFADLMAKKADADPKCITCHTVGFGDVSGYRREFGAKKLVNVGCESCHGPGSLHVQEQEGDKSISFNFRTLDAGDCMKCHYGEFSRPFQWDKSWPLIKHGKEPVPDSPAK